MNAMTERADGFLDCVASIVTYRNPPDVAARAAKSCLDTSLRMKLYVFDNSPSAELQAALEGLPAAYHHSPVNVGFGRGHNWCLERAEPSRYYLVLNPDVFVPRGTLEELAGFMDRNPAVGIVSPKVVGEDGRVQHLNKRDPTVYDLFLRRFLPAPLRRAFRNRLERYEMRDAGYESGCDVPFLPGAFMFCRTGALRSVSGFDPRYFLYFEDADLTRKMRAAGWRTVYHPGATVTHVWDRAAHKNLRMAAVLAVNGVRYFSKWGWKLR